MRTKKETDSETRPCEIRDKRLGAPDMGSPDYRRRVRRPNERLTAGRLFLDFGLLGLVLERTSEGELGYLSRGLGLDGDLLTGQRIAAFP